MITLRQQVGTHLEQAKLYVRLLQSTVERRCAPDEVLDNLISSIGVELEMLGNSINKFAKE